MNPLSLFFIKVAKKLFFCIETKSIPLYIHHHSI